MTKEQKFILYIECNDFYKFKKVKSESTAFINK
jgi:hypothetical protein